MHTVKRNNRKQISQEELKATLYYIETSFESSWFPTYWLTFYLLGRPLSTSLHYSKGHIYAPFRPIIDSNNDNVYKINDIRQSLSRENRRNCDDIMSTPKKTIEEDDKDIINSPISSNKRTFLLNVNHDPDEDNEIIKLRKKTNDLREVLNFFESRKDKYPNEYVSAENNMAKHLMMFMEYKYKNDM